MASMEVLNESTVTKAIGDMESMTATRLIVTDQTCRIIYDSYGSLAGNTKYAVFPEIVSALDSNNVFSWTSQNGTMCSKAATPIYSYGTLVGCIYLMENDAEQGALIESLRNNTLTVTVFLEIVVILFSLFFSKAFTRRLRRIMVSMRIIREGNYDHRVKMGGHDELTVLGDEFNELTDRLQKSENKRSRFVSDASHELKTPLASIKLLTDSILQNDMDPQTLREFVGDIGTEADRLTRMTQKLLALSKTDVKTDVEKEIIFLAPTVEKVARMLSAQAESANITLVTDLSEDAPVLIQEDDLYQIVFNLVENGLKYNRNGGTLTVTLSKDSENVYLSVADTGMGIPEDSIEHIFERFYRVDKARSRKTGGSGLGLSIVRTMVERNDGTIHVESQLNKGSVFTVSFPFFETEALV